MDEEVEQDNLVQIPLVAMDGEEPPLKSDPYLESLLIEGLTKADDNDDVDVAGLADMA